MDLDENNRPAYTPSLPEWGLPKPKAAKPAIQGGNGAARSRPSQNRTGLVRNDTLAAVLELAGRAGPSLSRFVLQKYAGTTDPGKIGFAKLTIVLDKLTDIAKGIGRLKKARAEIGDQRFSEVCRELNLANDSIDEIPDRATLAALLEVVEAEARANGAQREDRDSVSGIVAARGQLLQEARKAAERTGGRMGDLIVRASVGTLTLEQLKDLTDANIAEVEKATSRLRSIDGRQETGVGKETRS
ncbi:MAG: hypothetical protein LC130_17145 [Bryobacterales bacterium]|nr:hypothetical protein [Bryobacterales bacterium]